MTRVVVGPCAPCNCDPGAPLPGMVCCDPPRRFTTLTVSCGGNIDFSCEVCDPANNPCKDYSASSIEFYGARSINGGYTMGAVWPWAFGYWPYIQWLGTQGSLTDPGKHIAKVRYPFRTDDIYAFAAVGTFGCRDYYLVPPGVWAGSTYAGGFALQRITTYPNGSQDIGESGLVYGCDSLYNGNCNRGNGGAGIFGCYSFAGGNPIPEQVRVCDGAPMSGSVDCADPYTCGTTYTSWSIAHAS